jgi:hypothetical protein
MGHTHIVLAARNYFDAGRLTIDDYLCLNVAKSALDESILPVPAILRSLTEYGLE